MRKQATQLLRKTTAVFLSVVMAFSLCVASPQQAQAGMIPASMAKSLGKVALSAVKGSLAWGLGVASDATANDATASVFSTTRALILGKQRALAEKTIDLIENLTAELDALCRYTYQSSSNISNMIKELTENTYQANFLNNAGTPVDNFTTQYNTIVGEFNDLMKAFVAYNENPSDENKIALEAAYDNIYGTYFKGKGYAVLTDQLNDLFKKPIFGDATTTGFLSLISPYDSSTDINSTSDLTDPNSASWVWRSSASIDATYLGLYRRYINSVTNLQSNVHGSMNDAATLVVNAAYLYLQAYRYYCEFQAMLYASDSSLSESDARTQTQQLWEDFYDISHKLIRGINQMYYTQEDVFTTYMRTSDVAQTRSIVGYSSPISFDVMLHEYEDANGYKGGIIYPEHDPSTGGKTPTTKMYTNVIQKSQHIYQFRLVSDPSKMYAIRTSTNTDSEGDGVSRAFYAQYLTMVAPTNTANDQTCPSTDLFTVLKPLEGGFSVPVSMSELSAIAKGTITSYDTGDTMTANLRSELAMAFGEDNVHLPNVTWHELFSSDDEVREGPNIMPLRTKLTWNMLYKHPILDNPDGLMVLGTASMPYSEGNAAEFDLESNLRDYTHEGKFLHNMEAVVMWVCDNPSATVSLANADGGDAWVTIGDSQLSEGGSGTYAPGTAMTIRVEPYNGNTISSVQLVDKNNNVLETLLSDEVLNDEATITAQEILSTMAPNADGAYEFSVPVPCQDATVRVTYASIDPSLLTYDVTLNDVKGDSGYDAVLQFGSYDYLGKKAFSAGDEVVVSVVGYDHHMAQGITITDAHGNALDVAVNDVSSQTQRTRPSERIYTFTMPAQDVSVTPNLRTSKTVTVNDSANVTHTFQNLGLYTLGGDTDWAHAKAVDFVEGDTVSIAYEVEAGYLVSGIEVFDSKKQSVAVTPRDGRISFTMPSNDVTVRFSEEALSTHAYMLTLAPADDGLQLQFISAQGDDLNLLSKQFYANDTVSVRAGVQSEGDVYFSQMVLTEEGSNKNVFAAQEGTYNMVTGKVTFKMPSANATLSSSVREKPVVTLDTSVVGASFQFVDADGNGLDGTQQKLVPSDTVRAKIQISDEYMLEGLVLTADGAEENIFEAQDGTYDAQSGLLTFAMPDTNATLSATLRKKPVLTLGALHDGASFEFVGAKSNAANGSQQWFEPGETVQAKLQMSDLLELQEIVLTADGDGAAENIFATQDGTYDAQSGLLTFAMPDANATLSATFTELVPEEVDGITTDDEGRILVSTYEDLVKFSQVIRKRPEHYSNKDIVLTNNIDANGKEPWTEGIGSIHDKIYYNGTFEGNGYCIFGMRISSDSSGGLFEAVGESGVVKDLFLFDCDYTRATSRGGGIAAVNYGRIEYCVNGLNLTNGIYIRPDTGELVSLKEYNSYVNATTAGGIVGGNYGTVYACRSVADVNATWYAGGIAGDNSKGTISNCAGNGKVTSTSVESMMNQKMGYHYGSGGICAQNYGTVEGGYSSAVVSAREAKGNISFEQGGAIVDTYYTTSEGQEPFEYTGRSHTETNVNGLARGQMMKDSFVQALSDTGSNSVTWVRHDALNAGLPRIKSQSSKFTDVVLSSNGVTIKGDMHSGAKVVVTPLNGVSKPWSLLAKSVDGYAASAAYACTIQDAAGNQIPGDLWVQSELTFMVPVKSENTAIAVLHTDGSTQRVNSVNVAKAGTGYTATFAADGVEGFMVLQKSAAGSASSGGTSSGTTTAGTSVSGTGTTVTRTATARTGDYNQVAWVVIALAVAGFALVAVGLKGNRGVFVKRG